MIVRKYIESDRGQLLELWSNAFPSPYPHNEPSFVLNSKLEVDDLIFVAELDGAIIGSCMGGYDGHRGWLYSVSVSTKIRRGGIGSKLVKHTVKHLGELGCIKVNLQIVAENAQVISFYESLGFIIEDRISMGIFVENA
jgi:ribosomal protein S18 acetylase RimI-like enzyme